MVDYGDEVRKEAVDFVSEWMDEVIEAIQNDESRFLDGSMEDTFFEMVTDRSYTLSDAAFVIENSRNVEEDSGLWEGKDPQDAIEIQAAFTYSNDVHCEVEDIYDELKEDYTNNFDRICDDLNEKHKDDVDEDYDPEEDAMAAASDLVREHFENEYANNVQVVTDKREQVKMIEYYLRLAEKASMWSGYPVGGSYIDSRCGVGFGMPEIHDYVEYDHKIANAIPELRGMSKNAIADHLESLKKEVYK